MKKLLALILAATLLLACAIPAQAADSRKVEAAAVLYDLGLFQGTGTNADGTPDFSLDRAAKRAEGVTLLVRLLGIGEETLKNASDAPFSDVPGWAKPYVNFAYENDLTKGVSAEKLGANDAVTAAQYLTFVLRAMGYVSGEDFDWSASWALTDRLGITHGEYNAKTNKSFQRGDAALVSACALKAACKNGKTLYENIFGKRLPDDLRAQLSALAGETARRDTSKAAGGYASYLDELDLPDLLGQPQYSQKQICAMQGYTLDQLKDAIYTVPDMIQYLVETNYGENPVWENDVHFSDGSYEWAINKSAAGAKDSDCPSCGAVSNLTRYILEGDYDDCGYILWGTYDKDKNETNGGHVINFYQIGNQYVTFDYTSVSGGSFRPNDTNCWVVGSTKAIAEQARKQETDAYTIHTIVLDRGAYRMQLPLGWRNKTTDKSCYFTAGAYRYDAELLYQDAKWQQSCPSFEYHPFFDDSVSMDESRYPDWAFDGTTDEYGTPSDVAGLCIYYRGFTIEPGYRFGPIEEGQSIQVYLDGVRQTNFTLQNSSPATCRLTVREDGTIVCGRASADTTIYIRCGTSEGRYILGGP